jgi:hypothetical protein
MVRLANKGIGYRQLIEEVGKKRAEEIRSFLNRPRLYWQTSSGDWVRGDSNIAREGDW